MSNTRILSVLLSLALFLTPVPAFAATQNIFLAQGFNFYTLTVAPGQSDTIKDATTLFAAVAELDQLFRFNATTKAFEYVLRLPGGNLFGTGFALEAGRGYVLKASAQKSVSFSGEAATSAVSNLTPGFNFVGFPTVATVPTAYGLLGSNVATLKSVFIWNYNTQAFQFVIRLNPTTLFGTDFELLPGTAFFVDAVQAVTVNFGEVTPPSGVNVALTGTIDSSVLSAGSPSLAPNLQLSGEFQVKLLNMANDEIASVQATPVTGGYAYNFAQVPAYTAYKLVAKGPNNEYAAGIVGQVVSNTVKNLNPNTTALSLMIERDQSKFVALVGSAASTYAAEEDRLLTLMAGSLDTVKANLERMRKLVATQGITLDNLRAGLLARVEIPLNLATQLATYYADPSKRAVEAMDAYKQAIALIGSQAGRETQMYVEQALTLLGSITGASYDGLTATQKKDVAVATAAANAYMGDILQKTGGTATASSPRSFAAAYRSLGAATINPSAAAYYKKGLDALNAHKKAIPADQSDPAFLAAQLKNSSPLAAEDPQYMQQASQTADALKAKLDTDSSLGGKVQLPGADLDVIDVVEKKAEAFQKGGNPAGAIEAFNQLNENDASFDATKKEKATKTKKFGIGKARMDMGDVENAFDDLKAAVGDVVSAGGVQDGDYAKFAKINEALLAMAAVIEQLKAQSSQKLNQTGNDAFRDPATIAQKMDKKSEIYVTVVVVVVAGGDGAPKFGDNVLQTVTDQNRILLNEGMALMSEFHFQFQVQSYAAALAALVGANGDAGALKKFTDLLAVQALIDAEAGTDEIAKKNAIGLRSQATLQAGLVHFFRFRVSILQKAKNDDHRKNALRAFYTVRDKYSFLATEVEGRIAELERFESLVETAAGSDFDKARIAMDQAVKLLRVGDRVKAFTLLEDAVTKFNAEYAATADAAIKKEALKGWAEAKFYRFFAYPDATDEDKELKELVGMTEAVAALNLLRIRYSDLRSHAMDLQNRLTNAQLFAGQVAGEGEASTDPAVIAGAAALPPVYNHAMKLKEQADQLYKIGDTANALAAFNAAKGLFDLMMVEATPAGRLELVKLLTDDAAKLAAVKALAGIEIRNGFTATGPRLVETNTLYWKIVAASAQKEEALLFARRYYTLRSDGDRKTAVELLNRAIAKFPEVPFVAEIRQLIDELTGATTTNATAPILSNLKSDPAMLSYSANAQEITVNVDALDPDPVGEIMGVKLSILFGGILQAELNMANVPRTTTGTLVTPVLQLHPGVNRQTAPAKGPRWTVKVPVPSGSPAGEYIFVAKAVNKAGIANELKGGFFLRPAEDAFSIADVLIDAQRNLVVKLSKEFPGDTQDLQLRTRIDILQLPPAGVANVAPIPVAGYVNLPLQRVDPLTRTVKIADLFNEKFPFFGQFVISAKIVNLVGPADQQVLFKRAIPYFHERAVDQANAPSVVAFKEFLKVLNYDAAADNRTPAQRLVELEKFAVATFMPGTMDPAYKTMFDAMFRAAGKSVMTINLTADTTPKEILEVEVVRPDLVIIHAFMKREQTYSAGLNNPVLDPSGAIMLPPGSSGYKFVKEEWLEFPLQLVNNRWYVSFGQSGAAAGDTLFVDNVYINAQNVLSALLSRPVDALTHKVRLAVVQSPDPTRGIFVPRPVQGFDALELRPINAREVKEGETVTALLAAEFALPMQTVIPATFPVYGPIEFAVRVVDRNGAEKAAYSLPFYRQLPEFTAIEFQAIKSRIAALKSAIEAKNYDGANGMKSLSAVNGKANEFGADLLVWYNEEVKDVAGYSLGIDVEALYLHRMDVNRAFASFDVGLPFQFEWVRLADGKWYWDTTPMNYFVTKDMPQILGFYFGGNNDLVVQTNAGRTFTTQGTGITAPNTDNVAVKLAVLKPRADGSFQPVTGYTKPTLFYAGRDGIHEWKIALSQALPPTFAEYGDLLFEAQLHFPETTPEPQARWQMPYFRPFVSQSDEAVRAAALQYVQALGNAALNKAAKLDAIRALCFGGQLGPIDALELPALIDALGTTLAVVPDEMSFMIHYPRPDFAEMFGMAKFSGTYAMPLPGGLWSQATGMQLLPPGGVGFQLADFYAPVNLRFRLFNGQWLKTNDDPWGTVAGPAGMHIFEAYIDENGALVVRTAGTPDANKTYAVKASLFTPPPVAMPGMGDVPVQGYQNIDAVRAADGTWRVEPSRLFGANFPVFGPVIIAAQLVNMSTVPTSIESETRFVYYRVYQNAALETPIKTRFTAYLTALQGRNLATIAPFWTDGGAIGVLPQSERQQIEFVTSKINRMAFTVDQSQIMVNPLTPDRVAVTAMVETKFEYKADEWMGVYHPFTGEMILPAGNAGAEILFYRPFNLLFGQFKRADGTLGWFLVPQAAGTAAPVNPEIVALWQDAADNFVVNLNMARQDLRVRIELFQPPSGTSADFTPVAIPGFSGVTSPLRTVASQDGLSFTIPRAGDTGVFRPALQAYGDLIVQAVLFADGTPGTVLSTYNMPWYRPFELSDAARTALIGLYKSSRTAFVNPDWNTAKAGLQNLVENPATLDETNGGSVAEAHGLIHGALSGFNMVFNQHDPDPATTDGPDSDFYIEMLGADEAIVHCWNVRWTGQYKNDSGMIYMQNGAYLLPAGQKDQQHIEWRSGFRRFVRVNNQWRIRAFGFADSMYGHVGPVWRFGDIVYNNMEWNSANGIERYVVGVWVGTNDVPIPVKADLLQYDPGNSQYNTLNSDLELTRDWQYPGQMGVAYYVIPKADLIAGQTLVPDTGYDIKAHFVLPGGTEPEDLRESWNSFWHSSYVPIFDLPVSRANMSAGGKIERSYGLAPDGRIAAFYDFGEIPPATYNTLYAYQFPGENEPRMWGPFVAAHVPDANNPGNGYSDIARILTVTVPADFDPWSVRSEADLLGKGFTISADGPLFFAPIVPQGAWFDYWPAGVNMFEVFAGGGRANGYLFDSDPFGDSILTPIPAGKLAGETVDRFYQFMDEPAAGQINPIFSAVEQVSPIFFQSWVWKPNGDTLPLLSSLAELQAYGAANEGKVADLGHLFGRPIVEVLQAGVLPGRALIQTVNGMAPTQALPAVGIPTAMPQHMVQGLGFGWSDWTATRALYFQPATGNPILIMNNTDSAWGDYGLSFPSTVFAAITANTPGVLVIRALNNGTVGDPLSNPFPVVIQAGALEQGGITAVNGVEGFTQSITLPVTVPYRLFKVASPLSFIGTNLGMKVAEGMAPNRALVFVTGTVQEPMPYVIATNDYWSAWGPAEIAGVDIGWLPENEPGRIFVAPFDSNQWRPLLGSPLTVPFPAVIQYERQDKPELQGILRGPAFDTLLTDAGGFVDLSTATPTTLIKVTGRNFGAFVTGANPTMDLAFLPFNGQPLVPIFGNNLTGWTDTELGPFPIPAAAQGMGTLVMRRLGVVIPDEDLLVRFPGGVMPTIMIEQVNGQTASMGDPGTYVNIVEDLVLTGSGFGSRLTGTNPTPTRFLYVVNSADFLNAPLRLLLLTNVDEGWGEQMLTIPASIWENTTETDEGGGIFITDAPIVPGGTFNMISNIAMVEFRPSVQGIYIEQVEQIDVPPMPTDGSSPTPIDMTGFTAPNFNINVRNLPPVATGDSPTHALYWHPSGVQDPVPVATNLDAAKWAMDGNGANAESILLAMADFRGTGVFFLSPYPFVPYESQISNQALVTFPGGGGGTVNPGFQINTINGGAAPTGDMMQQVAVQLGTSFDLGGTFPASQTNHGLFFFAHTPTPSAPIQIPTDISLWSASTINIAALPQGVAGEGHLMIGPAPYNPTAQPADLSNAVKVQFPGGGSPSYPFSFTSVHGATVPGEYDPNTMAPIPVTVADFFFVDGTFPTKSIATATHKLSFIYGTGVNPTIVMLANNDAANDNWEGVTINQVAIPSEILNQTGFLVIQNIAETGPNSVAKPVKVTFGSGTGSIVPWSAPTIVSVNGINQGAGVGDSVGTAIALSFEMANDIMIGGAGFGSQVPPMQESLALFFVIDPVNQFEILKQNSEGGWSVDNVIGRKPMNHSGTGYLVFRTHTSAEQQDWAVDVSNKVWVNVPAGGGGGGSLDPLPIIQSLSQGGGDSVPVPYDGSYIPLVSSSPFSVNAMDLPGSNTPANYALWFFEDGQTTPYQLVNNGSTADWNTPDVTVSMGLSMLTNRTGKVFFAQSGYPNLDRSNMVKVAFDNATPPPVPTVVTVNNQEQMTLLRTGQPFSVQGLNFGDRSTVGATRRVAIVDVTAMGGIVWQIDNTHSGWSDGEITGLVPPANLMFDPEHSFEIGIFDMSGDGYDSWLSHTSPFNVQLWDGSLPAITSLSMTSFVAGSGLSVQVNGVNFGSGQQSVQSRRLVIDLGFGNLVALNNNTAANWSNDTIYFSTNISGLEYGGTYQLFLVDDAGVRISNPVYVEVQMQ